MRCPKCDGFGIVGLFTPNVEKCTRCNGTGGITQTNEQWLRSASTDELADTLYRLCNHASIFGGSTKEEFKVWLKEVHR